MKFISTSTRHTPYETLEDIKPDPNQGRPRHCPSYHETAKKAKPAKKTSS